jgi:hypothetical protein
MKMHTAHSTHPRSRSRSRYSIYATLGVRESVRGSRDRVHTAAALWMSRVDPRFLVLPRLPRYPEMLPRFSGGLLEPTLKTRCGAYV